MVAQSYIIACDLCGRPVVAESGSHLARLNDRLAYLCHDCHERRHQDMAFLLARHPASLDVLLERLGDGPGSG